MTVSLELDRAARARGLASQFVPTGQTGIAIAGWGISVDAVVADFIAGAAERLVVEGSERGGDLLLVEGQGSIVHPAYSGVTLGLIHGSAPHAFVLCHQAGTTEVEGYPGHPLPSLPELVELHEAIALPRAAGDGRLPRDQHAAALATTKRAPRSPRPRPRRDCRRRPGPLRRRSGCSTRYSTRSTPSSKVRPRRRSGAEDGAMNWSLGRFACAGGCIVPPGCARARG